MSKNLYQVRIDGQIMPNSFTYEELLLNGILEFDDIHIKNVYNQYWCKVSDFIFPEEQDPNFFNRTESSMASSSNQFEIDECGQLINHSNLIQRSIRNTPISNSSINTQQNNSTQNPEKESIWNIILTIIVIIAVIILLIYNVICGILSGICGYMFLRKIWNNKSDGRNL